MTIEKHELAVSTTGSAGSATGSGILTVPYAELLALYVDYHADAPATTDLTISSPGNPASVTLLTLTNVNNDGWYYPKVQQQDSSGSAVSGGYSHPLVHGSLLASLAGCDPLSNAVVITFYLRV